MVLPPSSGNSLRSEAARKQAEKWTEFGNRCERNQLSISRKSLMIVVFDRFSSSNAAPGPPPVKLLG